MSAIGGIFYTNGKPVDPAVLERMSEVLAHRGPDDAGTWSDGPAGLVHRMFRTTPESLHERLPRVQPGPELAITADARIDNREELIRTLKLHRGCAAEITDSEIILAAYERWGAECPERLLGDFAFAIWDGRRRELFCARDAMGVKPFYYHASRDCFGFATEIKALHVVEEVPRRLNETRVATYLGQVLDDVSATFYEEILRLPAAHTLTVSQAGAVLRRYWQPDLDRETRFRTDGEYAEAFREIFTEAVYCRMRSAFRVGSHLSGGLDSSSIACTARNLNAAAGGGPLPTFSAVFPSLPEGARRIIDERPYVDAVLAQGGFEPHRIQADRVSPLVDLDRILWHCDEAVLGPNLFMNWEIYREAQSSGVRVLLDGVDGDSVVSHGLEHFALLFRQLKWRTLAREVTAFSRMRGVRRKRVLAAMAIAPNMPEWMNGIWSAGGRTQPLEELPTLLSPASAARLKPAAPQERFVPTARSLRQRHWEGLQSGVLPYVLEVMDKTTGAFNLETRFPFFDRRLIEFCLSVPSSQRLRMGWPRWILRQAMEGVLPREVQWRVSKSNLGPCIRQNLLDMEGPSLRECLRDPAPIQEHVDIPALAAAYDRYAASTGASPCRDQDVISLYAAVVLHRWLRDAAPAAV